MSLDSTASPEWPLGRRIAFRFALAYWLLYCLPFPFESIPGTGWVASWYQGLVDRFVPWVGAHALHLAEPVVAVTNGSGDTTFRWIRLLCIVILAAAATLIFSLLDRKRPAYPWLDDALHVYVRFFLAASLWSYGMVKVIQLQFPVPGPDRLLQTYAESSPMGLLWTFMGSSTAYTAFAGATEILGGLLLFFRRTTMLGALVAAGVMTNVVALNFCYDVPVKIGSGHLLAMAIYLLLPDLGRLFDLFVRHRAVAPRDLSPPPTLRRFPRWAPRWAPRGLAIARTVAWVAFCAYLSIGNLAEALEAKSQRGRKPAIYGRFAVAEFLRNDVAPPPLTTDTTQWRLATFSNSGVLVRYLDNSREYFDVETNPIARTMTLTDVSETPKSYTLRFTRTPERELSLEGPWVGGDRLKVLLKPLPKETVLLDRGFHWVNEYPYSR